MVINTKYIFVTGGVTSSLGKGIIAASLGKLLQARGYRVTIQKLDPYINVDSGTLNPYEHGECYVTEDGAETDLDLGHYERFLNINTTSDNNITTGKIYQQVIEKERKGDFLGKTVQIIPHITDAIKQYIQCLGNTGDYDIVITEVGGTVGDIESLPYIEAVRQLKWSLGERRSILIHLTLVPYLSTTGELKTKPTQHSIKTLMGSGVQADVLVCRTRHQLPEELKNKLALFCNLEGEAIIQSIDTRTIYEVPKLMLQEELDTIVLKKLALTDRQPLDLAHWDQFINWYNNPKHQVNIGLIGKYVELPDAYKSILEALIHAGVQNNTRVHVNYIHSAHIDDKVIQEKIRPLDGIVVAPGFGERGIQGKIDAIAHARVKGVPFLGICLGMQMAVIEFARNVLGYEDANSTEMNKATSHPVITLMESQKKMEHKGGTMRLGGWECQLKDNSKVRAIYGKKEIVERHRHRYELNTAYREAIEAAGLIATGINPKTGLVEVVELPRHPWFVAVQYHPEYKSRVENPHPLFVSFVKGALAYRLMR